MAQNKKKQEDNSLSEKIFKVLVVLVILIFSIIIIGQPSGSFSFSQNKLREPSQNKPTSTNSVPGELKWTDSFKGISNEKSDSKDKGFLD